MSQKLENQYARIVALRNQARGARQALVDRATDVEGRADLSEIGDPRVRKADARS